MYSAEESKRCRICLGADLTTIPLYENEDSMPGDIAVGDIIEKCTYVQVKKDDGFPQQICYPCAWELFRVDKFRSLCERTDGLLKLHEPIQVKIEFEDDDYEESRADSEVGNSFEDSQQSNISADESCRPYNECSDEENLVIYAESNITSDGENSMPPSTLVTCNECDITFLSEESLFEHQKEHVEKPFSCDKCSKKYAQKKHLNEHLKMHLQNSSTKEYNCETCGKNFTSMAYLKQHLARHLEKKYICKICKKLFAVAADLKAHLRFHTVERPFACDKCNKRFIDSTRLKVHQQKHTGIKSYKCTSCDQCFFTKVQLLNHERAIHSGEPHYVCQDCGKRFHTLSSLSGHRRMHACETNNECTHCKLRFLKKHDLQRHMFKMHNPNTPFHKTNVCDECGKKLSDSSSLAVHKRRHAGIKEFKCMLCDESFVTKIQLENHERKHTGEKPFRCDLCDRSYASQASLCTHRKTHFAPLYKCKECPREFRFMSRLKTHMIRHIHRNTSPSTVNLEEDSMKAVQEIDIECGLLCETELLGVMEEQLSDHINNSNSGP